MKALAAIEKGKLGLVDIQVPKPKEFEALVRMDACAICNSTDHKLLKNELFPGVFPAILGHEVIGTVVETGTKVNNFKPKDRVFRQRLESSHLPAGFRSSWGGFAEYGIVIDEWAKHNVPYGPSQLPHDQQKLLVDIPPAHAAGMVTLMECLDITIQCGAKKKLSVAVVGSGPVGQAIAMFSKLLSEGPVYGFGRNPNHSERFAKVCKTDGYITGEKYPAAVESIVKNGGFDITVEAVGSPEALDTCIKLAGKKGRVFVYGIPPDTTPYAAGQKSGSNVKFLGAVEGRTQAQLVEWLNSKKVDMKDWVSHIMPLAEYRRAFDMVAKKEANKAVLLPGTGK